MKKRTTETFEIEDRGIMWTATVIYYEYGRGGTDEISVTVENDAAEAPQQRHRYRVTDEDARECVFRSTDVDGESDPNRASLKAIGRFGWTCKNRDIESLAMNEHSRVGPTLQYMDDGLETIIGMDNSPVADYPFLLDVLETAQTGIALVNTLLYPQYMEGADVAGLGDDYLDLLFSETRRDDLKLFLAFECNRDPYHRLFLPELADVHYGLTIDEDTVESTSQIPHFARAMGVGDDDADGSRPRGFDGVRYGDTR